MKERFDEEFVDRKHDELIERLLIFGKIIITGEIKSHCVARTIENLLNDLFMGEKKVADAEMHTAKSNNTD